jgi:hypothetical protein
MAFFEPSKGGFSFMKNNKKSIRNTVKAAKAAVRIVFTLCKSDYETLSKRRICKVSFADKSKETTLLIALSNDKKARVFANYVDKNFITHLDVVHVELGQGKTSSYTYQRA